MVGLNTRPSKDASPVKISSSFVDLTFVGRAAALKLSPR